MKVPKQFSAILALAICRWDVSESFLLECFRNVPRSVSCASIFALHMRAYVCVTHAWVNYLNPEMLEATPLHMCTYVRTHTHTEHLC